MNQISRTFVLIGLVVIILLAMHLLPPLTIGETELRHVNVLSDVMPEVYQERDGIDVIPTPEPPKAPTVSKRDTTAPVASGDTVAAPQAPAASDTLTAPTHHDGPTLLVDYSMGLAGGMNHFYQQLLTAVQSRPVRIAYFGDSFIEGDILTCDLREQLQTRFGGEGVGWVDMADQLGGFRQTVKRTFKGITEYEVVKKPFNARHQSIAQRYFTADEGCRVQVSGSTARKHLKRWQKSTLYFRTEGGLNVTANLNGDSVIQRHADGATGVQTMVVECDSTQRLTYNFSGITPNTYLYGMALESRHGVILDNFSMRGSAGFTIAQIPLATLQDFARLRPYDLIVLHFGLNVASEKSHAANYQSYIKHMQKAIEHLRMAYPQASVLVVSMPDRDQRTDAGIRTMKGVEALVAYQQILASNCQVAYFNLFEAMGGRESMKGLVEKGLANKDYTHLSFGGGRRIARYLYDALMAGYNDYRSNGQ
jgi:lysophospholipase L1-like esterase